MTIQTNNTTRNLAKLPEKAYVKNTIHCQGEFGEPPVICVKRGEMGYYPIYTDQTAEQLNERRGVTPQQASAMLNGSLAGWDIPAADPDNECNAGGPGG
jgi:hypothetical protein